MRHLDPNKKIRVMVIDDSSFMRKRISAMINSQNDMEVVATARSGEEALQSALTLKPDVVTLDVEMQPMDGLTCLGYIMSECPTPVIMVSAYTQQGSEAAILALELGALDFVQKPGGVISLSIDDVATELLEKIRVASMANLKQLKMTIRQPSGVRVKRLPRISKKIIAMGASTGGPGAIASVVSSLPAEFPASLIIVQHMPDGFTKAFANRLNWESHISVKEAEDKEMILPGTAYVARGGHMISVARQEQGVGFELSVRRSGNHKERLCPSVDRMMESVAAFYGPHVIGVVLTGMGTDGTQGLKAIFQAGGFTIAQDESSSVVYGMPKSCINAGVVHCISPLESIPSLLTREVLTPTERHPAGLRRTR
jgi:two-component system chemotaxis response regulator CheB